MPALRPYRAVWRLPGAPQLLVVGLLARLGIGMTPLALLLLVQQVTGRYTPAALTGAGYALAAAAAGPVAGRAADRLGPTPVLVATALAHPAALGLLLFASHSRHPVPPVFAAAVLAGATYPPLTAALRGAWSDLTREGTDRHRWRGAALAAETSLFEVVFVAGPLLVSLFVAFADPTAAIVGAALVTFVGTLLLARSQVMRALRPHPSQARTRGLGPLRAPGFVTVLACAGCLGLAFGVCGVAIPAFATRHGGSAAEDLAGLLLALWGLGSTAGGLWFGTRRLAMPLPRQFAWLLAAFSVTLAALSAMPTVAALAVALVLGGATIAPALTAENSLVSRVTPLSMVNEAYTWLVTVSVAASSAGGALAGVVIDRAGVPYAFALAGLAVGVGAVLAGRPQGALARADAQATAQVAVEIA